MTELIAGLIDVFADAPLSGNPLAVVQVADELSFWRGTTLLKWLFPQEKDTCEASQAGTVTRIPL